MAGAVTGTASSRLAPPWKVSSRQLAAPSLCALVLAVLLQPAAAHSVTLANAANITKCLGVDSERRLALVDCLGQTGAVWNWTSETAPLGGQLALASAGAEPKCLHRTLQIEPCEHVDAEWSWSPETLQIYTRSKHKRWCLGLIGLELLLEVCDAIVGTASDDQNGFGARAEQTWVLMPTDRPQILMLDMLRLPLRAAGRHIVDSNGRRVKLAGMNWGGAHTEQLVCSGLTVVPLRRIVKLLKYMGFSVVRLAYASQLHERDGYGELPPVPNMAKVLEANPELVGLNALEIFDRTVQAITDEGLLVVLNRRMGEGGKCCSGHDGSELWYGEGHSEELWLESLGQMTARYAGNPRVIGTDILSEPRVREEDGVIAWWGFPSKWRWWTRLLGFELADWRAAAARGALRVWEAHPDALVFVEGQLYATDLERVLRRPLKLEQECLASRIVYATHEYQWLWPLGQVGRGWHWVLWPFNFGKQLIEASLEEDGGSTEAEEALGLQESPAKYEEWLAERKQKAYYLNEQGDAGGAPVWISEFGTSNRNDNGGWQHVLRYLRESDADWCYGALEAEQAGDFDPKGLFDASRNDYAGVVGWKLQDLLALQRPQGEHEKIVTDDQPSPCIFDLEANRRRAEEDTYVHEYLADAAGDWQVVLCLLLWGVLLFLCPCGLCFLGLLTGCQDARPRGEAGQQQMRHLALNELRPGEYSEFTVETSNGRVMITPKGRAMAERDSQRRGLLCCNTGNSPLRAPLRCIGGW